MKHIKLLFCSAFAASCLSSCGPKESYNSTIDALPFKEENEDLWGAISADGKVIFSNEFKNLPSNVVDGLFFVEENDAYSLYQASEKPKLLLDGLIQIGQISTNSDYIIGVKENSHIQVYDKKGNLVNELTDIDGMEVVEMTGSFYNGYATAYVKKDKTYKMALLNTKCEIVKVFDETSILKDIYNDMILIKNDKDEWTIKDMQNKTILNVDKRYEPSEVRGGHFLKYNMMCASNGEDKLFLNTNGEVNKCPSRVKRVVDFNKNAYVYSSSDGGYGIMNMEHEILARDKYDNIDMTDNGFVAKIGENYEILNKSGEIVTKMKSDSYPYIAGFSSYVTKSGSRYSITDSKGEEINKNSYACLYDGKIPNSSIISDYFNWGNNARVLIDTLNYVARATLNKTLDEYDHFDLKSNGARRYSGTSIASVNITDVNKLTINMFECFDSRIANSSYNYYYDQSVYQWNSTASVNRVAAKVSARSEEMYKNCKSLLESKKQLSEEEANIVADIYNYSKNYYERYDAYTCYEDGDNIIFLGYVSDGKSQNPKEFIIGITGKTSEVSEITDKDDAEVVEEKTTTTSSSKKKTTKRIVNDEW
ncbi:MAG: hypothetical protein UH850_06685 [Paludibacteraceae bacterium]|nr:hypothetical protein [Paludibacteraceae bacterium]